ncbi:preprotein translocase subunit YajC [Pseudobythopirellula maris]|uniref:Sec translocon accessory complex subunit YajC n=1 Tax=Pseudobythopirellula maris TaxID=2527991 RepID=A0A5C5ZG34_9BACT|nr:preprotein translocase subunit YajC [Pseudobythopirellula maris]TWT86186.1 preprotein translocase subunit YajC [Pseudobythopirellula maris]
MNPADVILQPLTTILATAIDAAGPLLAQADAGDGGPLGQILRLAPIPLIIVLFYVMFILPQQNKQKAFNQLLENLKENDRVVTTGGLHGVVTSVQRDSGRLTLRIDEANGTKVRVSLWAIESVEGPDGPVSAKK